MCVKIAIVNLMPKKEETEAQFLNIFSSISLNIKTDFIYMKSHKSNNTALAYVKSNYKTLEDIKSTYFHGMIITGAPVERLAFDEVDYWAELKKIMDFSKRNVNSTLHICWGAQAGLYYHYKIPRHTVDKKIFGVFKHDSEMKNFPLFKGFQENFFVPHSRYFEIKQEDIESLDSLEILSRSKECGIYAVGSKNRKYFFITGHPEYDDFTLKNEYDRDVTRGLKTSVPKNYFLNDDASGKPITLWKSHSILLFSNWIYEYAIKTGEKEVI